MNKYAVMTSIYPPTKGVEAFAAMPNWKLIVVGDKKTPRAWAYPGVTFLDVDSQEEMGYRICSRLPFNHYARKNLGYLYAMQQGAELIADVDDDNIPYPDWNNQLAIEIASLSAIISPRFPNIYRQFTSANVWPRGLPLETILDDTPFEFDEPHMRRIGVWQFLADKDPDVDAVYRLTVNKEVYFEKGDPFCISGRSYAPFNSQNTVWLKSSFPFMLLPAGVTFRLTDILRGYIAQRCLKAFDNHLAFGPATVYQERNPHNFLADFESEIPGYLGIARIVDTLDRVGSKANKQDQLMSCYQALFAEGFITEADVALCRDWLDDVQSLLSGRP
jgi:glycosyltransferase involved in cell wall biosynthesis